MSSMDSAVKNLVFKNNVLIILNLILLLIVIYLITPLSSSSSLTVENISTQNIFVKDTNGVNRIVISGKVPDPIIRGAQVSRGTDAGGIILYDQEGDERAGLITTDDRNNVMLGLDSKDSMTTLIAVQPDGGSVLRMFEGTHEIAMRADTTGVNLTATSDGDIKAQLVEIVSLPPQLCAEFKGGLRSENPNGFPREVIRNACERRYPMEACEPCLPES